MQRRSFLKSIVAAATGPMLFNGCSTGFFACRKINIGVIGFGRIATTMDVPYAIKHLDKCRFVAVAEVDAKRREYGKEFIQNQYRKLTGEKAADVKTYADYRQMLLDPSIDAVMVCVPDHWHAIIATDAVIAGKDVWLQKPFTQTIEEGRILRDLAIAKGTVMQVASWQRSRPQFAQVCELVRSGRIGDIVRVEVGCGLDKPGGSSARQAIPENLDYDRWLGPTDPTAPYNESRVHTQNLKRISSRPGWIQLEPYGWGMITNWGAHQIDVAQWGLGKDDSGPESVEGAAEWMPTTNGRLWNVHTKYDLHYSYNAGKTDVNVSHKYPMGIKFIGEKGQWLYCMRGEKATPSDPKDAKAGRMMPLMASDKKLLEPLAANSPYKVHTSNDHWVNWLDAVLSRDPSMTVTNASIAQRTATACNLGYMCMKTARKIDWDAKNEKCLTPAALALMKPFERGDYNLSRAYKALKGVK